MLIAANKAVSIDYTLTNDAGEVIDSSAGGAPLAYLHGAGNIIGGLEKALLGKQVGDELDVLWGGGLTHVPPATNPFPTTCAEMRRNMMIKFAIP